jgi:hypothetical protein
MTNIFIHLKCHNNNTVSWRGKFTGNVTAGNVAERKKKARWDQGCGAWTSAACKLWTAVLDVNDSYITSSDAEIALIHIIIYYLYQ